MNLLDLAPIKGDCVIIDANARTADIQKHCFRTIEEYYIKNVFVVANTARAFENTARETAAEFSVNNRQREVYR